MKVKNQNKKNKNLAFGKNLVSSLMLRNKIIVAMSGGVDSSVAAALLKKQGLDVVGVFMKFWSPANEIKIENRCCSTESEIRARKIAKDAGFQTKVIYIELPKEVIWKRWMENSKTKTRFHWPKEEFERNFKEFEEPSPDEDVIIYDQKTPIEKWIKNYVK